MGERIFTGFETFLIVMFCVGVVLVSMYFGCESSLSSCEEYFSEAYDMEHDKFLSMSRLYEDAGHCYGYNFSVERNRYVLWEVECQQPVSQQPSAEELWSECERGCSVFESPNCDEEHGFEWCKLRFERCEILCELDYWGGKIMAAYPELHEKQQPAEREWRGHDLNLNCAVLEPFMFCFDSNAYGHFNVTTYDLNMPKNAVVCRVGELCAGG